MAYETIRYDTGTDGTATVTLDRPERLNAMTRAMADELIAVMDEIDGDDAVRVAIFTGAGRAYCAGADLSPEAKPLQRRTSGAFDMTLDADYGGLVSRRFFESTKPLIAAINGAAVGVGITSALPMDFRLASTTAKFGFVFLRRGLVPEAASSWFLPRLVGMDQALEWVYSGRVFEADEALRAGLVRSVHAPDELLPAARTLAREITAHSAPVAAAIARRMLWQLYGTGTPELAHELDSRAIRYLANSADRNEGVSSFLEKRPARFTMTVSEDLPEYFRRWQEIGYAQAFVDSERTRQQ